jgi:hypothetical protein
LRLVTVDDGQVICRAAQEVRPTVAVTIIVDECKESLDGRAFSRVVCFHEGGPCNMRVFADTRIVCFGGQDHDPTSQAATVSSRVEHLATDLV